MPNVVGRPAAVLPLDEGRGNIALGARYYQGKDGSGEVVDEYGLPTIYIIGEGGLGSRWDCQVGFMGMVIPLGDDVALAGGHIFGVLRFQLLGWPEGDPPIVGLPDVSVEAGLGNTFIGAYAESSSAQANFAGSAHLGANLSFQLETWTPYVSYRRYWGTADDGTTGAYEMDWVLVGVRFPHVPNDLAIEFYHGFPTGSTVIDDERSYHSWGFNVVIRDVF
ncbi:MAG: hypothetical protein ACYTFI_13245 [Planctomycetota bacterium]|jgi:hypothetical protein